MKARLRPEFGGWMVAFGALLVLHLLHVSHYRSLTDEAFIAFRCARNLMEHGSMSFNPGATPGSEPFHGFLWIVQLALKRWLGHAPEDSANNLATAYSIGTIFATAYLIRQVTSRRWFWSVVVVATSFLAVNRSFAVWATSGLETRCGTFWAVLGAGALLESLRGVPRRGPLVGLAWALAILTDPGNVLICLPALAMAAGLPRRIDVAATVIPPGVAALFMALAGGMNWTFGEIVPSMSLLVGGVLEYALWLWAIVILAGIATTGRLWSRPFGRILIAVLAGTLMKFLLTSSSAFEYRSLDTIWPFLAVALAWGCRSLFVKMRALPSRPILATAGYLLLITYGTAIPMASDLEARKVRNLPGAWHHPVVVDAEALGPAVRLPLMSQMLNLWNLVQYQTVTVGTGTRFHELFLQFDHEYARFKPFEGMKARGLLPEGIVAEMAPMGVFAYYSDVATHGTGNPLPDGIAANFEQPRLVSTLPPANALQPERFVYELIPGELYLTFLSKDAAWVRRSFTQRCIVFGGRFV